MSASAVMPAFAGIHDLETPRLNEVVDTRTASGHDAERVVAFGSLLVAAALAPAVALAQQAPDLSAYDCTRVDDGRTVAGDDLMKAGFQIASQGRFGTPNVMLVEPKTGARANCIIRQGSK